MSREGKKRALAIGAARDAKGNWRLLKAPDARRPFHPDCIPRLREELKSGERLMVAGGYPGTMSYSAEEATEEADDVAVSAALQINSDIARLPDEQLLNLAKAEHLRLSSPTFRSYTIEPDYRVAVIASDPGWLTNFIDTYGGILETTPLFLSNQSRSPEEGLPDHLLEMTISALQAGVSSEGAGLVALDVTRPAPVDMEACTLCGACAPICPRGAIRAGAYIDMMLCDRCGLCTRECPEKAIDLHAVEKEVIHTPAVVVQEPSLAEELAARLPEGLKGHVHRADALEGLFSSIYPRLVEEIVGHESSKCQYSPRLQKGCRRCLDACPRGAIMALEQGMVLDHTACDECGACVSSCPTGAMQFERLDDKGFYTLVTALDLEGKSIIISRPSIFWQLFWNAPSPLDGEEVYFLEHPLPAAMNETHLLLLAAKGARRVTIVEEETWVTATARAALSRANQVVKALLSLRGSGSSTVVFEIKTPRQWLADWFGEEMQTVDQEPIHIEPTGLTIALDQGFPGRRRLLSSILSSWIEGVSASLASSRDTIVCADEGDPYRELFLDPEKCTQCLACINECLTGALLAHEEEMRLEHLPSACVACGLCTDVCPEDALSARTGLRLEPSFFQTKVLFRAEPARCAGCGKIYGTKRSLERVRELLSSGGGMDLSLLDLCEDCRVRRMFEGLSPTDIDE